MFLFLGNQIEGDFPILGRKGKTKGTLNLRVKYIPVASLQNSYEVAGSYFNMSQGNRVRMYQTAHCGPPHTVPHFAQIQLPPGYTSFSSNAQYAPFYHPASCWKDLYEAIQVIKKLIEYYVECQMKKFSIPSNNLLQFIFIF